MDKQRVAACNNDTAGQTTKSFPLPQCLQKTRNKQFRFFVGKLSVFVQNYSRAWNMWVYWHWNSLHSWRGHVAIVFHVAGWTENVNGYAYWCLYDIQKDDQYMINKVWKYFSRRIFPALRTKVWPLNIQGQFGKHWKAEANHEQTSITSELMTRGDACSDFFFFIISLWHDVLSVFWHCDKDSN